MGDIVGAGGVMRGAATGGTAARPRARACHTGKWRVGWEESADGVRTVARRTTTGGRFFTRPTTG
ncbi:hypothetical protein Afil01_21380 [Actinorhabdospora filicis]|uniref:Uncharacterized protein n=1 Tax=Actinorhabdospora filicis TaxID=1785913 RepID=A0A9W6W9A9_9ACTN|nr:hypothetical protein Afil01_21380 [Actinorhabdospora filicis]